MQTRKLIRDAAVSRLSDATTGFNAAIAALASAYEITAFTINWAAGSGSFVQMFLNPDQLDTSQILEYPALALYTSTARESTGDGNRITGAHFSGIIHLHLDFYIKFIDEIEVDDTESIADAIEDAVLSVLHTPTAAWPANVTYNGDFEAPRESMVQLGDGYEMRVPFILTFEVHQP